MIIRVNTRSNGDQLADYISTLKDNDHIEILEVAGRDNASKAYLKQTILSMELNAQLTKCKNSFLNVQLNPAYGDDRRMTTGDWHRAADILAEELGYQDQRRVIVLHSKKGRTHAHVVWERYNHETQKVIPTKNSRLNAKFARIRIEKELGQKHTAWRNDKEQIKEALTDIWNSTETGAELVNQAKKAGFIIAAGTGNRPFMVVDPNGVSCDLVRQLKGIRTKEVRARLRSEQLITDKQAIEMVRAGQGGNSGKRERQQATIEPALERKAKNFADNAQDAITNEQQIQKDRINRFNDFAEQGQDFIKDNRPTETNKPTKAEQSAFAFAENKKETLNTHVDEQERLREEMRQRQERIKQKKKIRGHRR